MAHAAKKNRSFSFSREAARVAAGYESIEIEKLCAAAAV